MKRWKQYSLFLLLLISGLLLTGAGVAGEHTIYADYSRLNGWMTPALSLVFQGVKDGVAPWELFGKPVQTSAEPDAEEEASREAQASEESGEGGAGENIPSWDISGNSISENNISGNDISGNDISGNDASKNSVSQNSLSGNSVPEGSASVGQVQETKEEQVQGSGSEAVYTASDGKQYDRFGQLVAPEQADTVPSESEVIEETESMLETVPEETVQQTEPSQEEPSRTESTQEAGTQQDGTDGTSGEQTDGQETSSFTQVQDSYFDDALFIGDSRTVGLYEYGGFQESTTFFAKTSLTIYDLFEEPEKFARLSDGKKATLEEALTERKFGKIYIMLGINELGRGTTESFFNVYADAVNRIRMLQPDAVIFIQGIMRVGEEKNNTDKIFNNTNINERNQAISLMADNRTIFYLEVNDAVCDENGNLISEYTFDQIHLKAKYYQLWKDYLFAHGIVRN